MDLSRNGPAAVTKYNVCLVREEEFPYNENVTNVRASKELAIRLGYRNYAEEVVGLLCFDCKGNMIGYFEVARGTLTGCGIHPREVIKRACLVNAAAIILVHNHPSGDAQASEDDIAVTQRMNEACEMMGIKLMDHIIVGENACTSLLDEGKI